MADGFARGEQAREHPIPARVRLLAGPDISAGSGSPPIAVYDIAIPPDRTVVE